MHTRVFEYSELLKDILKLLQRYSADGYTIDNGESADIRLRVVSAANSALRKLYDEFAVMKRRVSLYFSPLKPIVAIRELEVSDGETVVRYFKGKRLAYRALLSGNGEVGFFNCGETQSISVRSGVGNVTEYKGLIGGDDDRHILIGTSSKMYVHSFEIYEDFSDSDGDTDLICGSGVCAAFLPKDFSRALSFRDINGTEYSPNLFYISENGDVVTVDRDKGGMYTLEYVAAPQEFEEGNYHNGDILLPPVLYDAFCYMCAAEVCPTYDGECRSHLTYKYREALENVYKRDRHLNKGRNGFYGVIGKKARLGALFGG